MLSFGGTPALSQLSHPPPQYESASASSPWVPHAHYGTLRHVLFPQVTTRRRTIQRGRSNFLVRKTKAAKLFMASKTEKRDAYTPPGCICAPFANNSSPNTVYLNSDAPRIYDCKTAVVFQCCGTEGPSVHLVLHWC